MNKVNRKVINTDLLVTYIYFSCRLVFFFNSRRRVGKNNSLQCVAANRVGAAMCCLCGAFPVAALTRLALFQQVTVHGLSLGHLVKGCEASFITCVGMPAIGIEAVTLHHASGVGKRMSVKPDPSGDCQK